MENTMEILCGKHSSLRKELMEVNKEIDKLLSIEFDDRIKSLKSEEEFQDFLEDFNEFCTIDCVAKVFYVNKASNELKENIKIK